MSDRLPGMTTERTGELDTGRPSVYRTLCPNCAPTGVEVLTIGIQEGWCDNCGAKGSTPWLGLYRQSEPAGEHAVKARSAERAVEALDRIRDELARVARGEHSTVAVYEITQICDAWVTGEPWLARLSDRIRKGSTVSG